MNSTITKNTTLSFIIPAMNEEKTIASLFEGISKNVRGLCQGWEVIFIDDGSTDGTWAEMERLAETHSKHVKAYKFAANRGKADALALGYGEASGDVVFTMDADLQDDPNEIPRFLEKLGEGWDIVSGWKKKRYDPWHKVLPSRVFNAMLSRVVGVSLHDHNCGFKAYRKAVVKTLPMYGDMHRMVPSLASFQGFKTTEIAVEHHAREHGVSKYGWGRMIIGFMDMTTVGFLQRFRDCPMHFAGKVAGVLGFIGAGLMAGAAVAAIMGAAASTFLVLGALCILSALLVGVQGLMLEQQVYRSMEQGRKIRVAVSHNADEKLTNFDRSQSSDSALKLIA